MSVSEMSEYERRAYTRLTALPSDKRSVVPRRVREVAGRASASAKEKVIALPGAEAVEVAYGKALIGLNRATTSFGIQSVSVDVAVRRHQKRNPHVAAPAGVRKLDLEDCDALVPSRKNIHSAVAVVEGATASLAITGALVSSTVTGGATATVVVGTVAVDSLAVLTGLGRIVGEVAVSYGYDPRTPEEEIFALQVIGLSLAVGEGAKASALASLSRLSQDMMRRATWTQLGEHTLVKIIQQLFGRLGLQLTHKKLAQVVPFAGVAISAGLNLKLVQDTHDAAQDAYRLRFLREKYRLDPGTDLVVSTAGPDDGGAHGAVVVDDLLEEALMEEARRSDASE